MRYFLLGFAVLCAMGMSTGQARADTLDVVKARGTLICGVSQGLPGFSNPDDAGNWTGLDVDLCRAIAAAVLGDGDKTQFVPLSSKERFTALQSAEIDVLTRNTTWTMSRDTINGLDFAGINYFDGQGFMVRKDLGISSAKELSGATICTNTGTTTELNAADYFRKSGMDYQIVAFEKTDEVVSAYAAGRCDVYTTDKSGIYANKLKLANPDEHLVLPETISKEPLGPAVRHGDNRWGDIVRWVHFAMVNAEELGVTSANAKELAEMSDNPSVRRLLGREGTYGEGLGLDRGWAARIISQVGNYGEIYDRHVGMESPLRIPRELNALWTEGGMQYAPPIR